MNSHSTIMLKKIILLKKNVKKQPCTVMDVRATDPDASASLRHFDVSFK